MAARLATWVFVILNTCAGIRFALTMEGGMVRSIHTLLVLLVPLGCGPSGSADAPDAAPIRIKEPPGSKQGNETAPGCDGVPQRGECKDGVAIYCDVTNPEQGEIRRIDCKARGSACVVDTGGGRGAICSDIAGTGTGGPCDSGVDYHGFCANTTAVWCDEEAAMTLAWECSSDGLQCQVDTCADGAYCCTASGGGQNGACGGLDFFGECGGPNGQTARWCGADGLHEINCAAQGKTCEVNSCATGAYCCGECETLGLGGACEGNTVRYCENGTIREYSCSQGESCQVGTCFWGAECCEAEDECATIGAAGVCDGNTVRYCLSGEIMTDNCTAQGKTCQVDTCSPGLADCC
jgi:hypothetical protein